MSQPPAVADDVAQRRTEALRLSRDGMSLREIGEKLGTSKDTAKRDIKAAERDAARQAAATAPAATELLNETPATAVDPEQPDRLTLALNGELRDHLSVLAEAGHTPAEGLSLAAEVLADAYRSAWDYELYPRGVPPRIRSITFHPYAPEGTTR